MDIIKRFSDRPVPLDATVIRTLSIDLGTTNCAIAESVCLPGYPPMCRVPDIVQPLKTGTSTSPLIPSTVVLTDGGETVLVGEGARRLRNGPDSARLERGRNCFYETKNDMGLNKTCPEAPEYLNQAYKVAGYLISFMVDAANRNAVAPCRAVTVTVPASFQMNQRLDTLKAAQMADLHLEQDCLLEEPAAALVDYLMSEESRLIIPRHGRTVCVVFDFGGGTCDVSVLSISANGPDQPLSLSELSISRYHRLGGGDIDAAIVHEVMIPALLAENGLDPLDLTWADKKKVLEPQLISLAETMKIGLCRKICEMEELGTRAPADREKFKVTAPPVTCHLESGDLRLAKPSLSAAQFEELLEPFLDTDFLYARETEYRLTQSIFSPLEDALDRAGIGLEEVDFCLITGGSVLIPQVRRAVEDYFGRDKVGCYDDPEKIQTAVVRGAAWNTIFKTVTGRPLIRPVLHDGIDLETNDGSYPLIQPGTPLPWPSNGSWQRLELEAPRINRLFVEQLRMKLMSSTDDRHLLNEVWDLPEAACPGAEIIMEYRVTAGKQFECRAFLAEAPDKIFSRTIENPLGNVVNPGSVRLKIEETREKLHRRKGGTKKDLDDYINLARWHAELNQPEKALHYLRTALKVNGGPNTTVLSLQGHYYKELKDFERAEKAYLEALRADKAWTGSLFNLALLYRDQKRYDEALAAVDQGLETTTDVGTFLALKADIYNRMGRKKKAKKTAAQAKEAFGPLKTLDNWSLGWHGTNAELLEDNQASVDTIMERLRRKSPTPGEPDDDAPCPVVKGGLIRYRPSPDPTDNIITEDFAGGCGV